MSRRESYYDKFLKLVNSNGTIIDYPLYQFVLEIARSCYCDDRSDAFYQLMNWHVNLCAPRNSNELRIKQEIAYYMQTSLVDKWRNTLVEDENNVTVYSTVD